MKFLNEVSRTNNLLKNLSTFILWTVKQVSINELFVFLASLLDYLVYLNTNV